MDFRHHCQIRIRIHLLHDILHLLYRGHHNISFCFAALCPVFLRKPPSFWRLDATANGKCKKRGTSKVSLMRYRPFSYPCQRVISFSIIFIIYTWTNENNSFFSLCERLIRVFSGVLFFQILFGVVYLSCTLFNNEMVRYFVSYFSWFTNKHFVD